MAVRLSLVVPSDRSRGNWSKMKHRTPENTFYSYRDKRAGTGFAETYGVFLLGDTENLSGHGLDTQLYVALLEQESYTR